MPHFVPVIRVFISSPGDCVLERRICERVLTQLAYNQLLRDKVHIDIVSWDVAGARVAFLANKSPQEAVNQQRPRPSECDIVVVIFSGKLGTPQADSSTGRAESGTDWELRDAIASSATTTFIFRRVREHISTDELEEYSRLQRYFESSLFLGPNRNPLRGINYYADLSEFEDTLAEFVLPEVLDFLSRFNDKGVRDLNIRSVSGSRRITAVQWTTSPFPGLRVFEERDSPIFFGRDSENAKVIELLASSGSICITGASGSGKSSLLAAGVIPSLRLGAIPGSEDWRIIQLMPRKEPLSSLCGELTREFPLVFREALLDSTEHLVADLVHRIVRSINQHRTSLLICVDQFEECFTVADQHQASLFLEVVGKLSAISDVHVIVCLRHDFLSRAIETPELSVLFSGKTIFTLGLPHRSELRKMIVGPAERAGIRFEDGLVDQILDDTGVTPGRLALLAFVLDEVYKLRTSSFISNQDYRTLGGVSGAIGVRAEAVFANSKSSEETLFRLFSGLVEVDTNGVSTRRRMQSSAIRVSADTQELSAALIAARLLVLDLDQAEGVSFVEVSHEAIFSEWPRLKCWIERTREAHWVVSRVRRDAYAWLQRGRPEHMLPRHELITEFWDAVDRVNLLSVEDVIVEYVRPEQDRLLAKLGESIGHLMRRDIGDRLAVIGDTRRGVGVRNGLPEIEWLVVSFADCQDDRLDSLPDDRRSWFLISKFPVTTLQFQCFIESDDGFMDALNWAGVPEDFCFQTLKSERNLLKNSPRDSVSWYQCVAFTRWLQRRLLNTELNLFSGQFRAQIGDCWEIRLPTENEWLLAAGSQAKLAFPFGKWGEDSCNTVEAGLGRSVAVGMYPNGVSPYGCMDMSGNVAEWCWNRFVVNDSLNDDRFEDSRPLKGGSFYHPARHASLVFRRKMLPSNAFSNFGFRLVVQRKGLEL